MLPTTRATLSNAIDSNTDECLMWPHYCNDRGYPITTYAATTHVERYAHRAVLIATVGPCPDGMEAAHSCGVRSCVNPRHLRWATSSENNYDRSSHGTMPRGHRHHWATLGDDRAAEAIARYRAGEDSQMLAEEYGVTRSTIQRWGQGKSRTHLIPAT